MNQENKENNFRKSIILGLCVFLSYSTYAKETFSFFYLYNSTFFHEATFIYMRNSQDTHTYVHAYNAFIKKVKLRVIKQQYKRWLVMIFLPLSSLVTTYSHHICMYACEYFHKEYISCGQACTGCDIRNYANIQNILINISKINRNNIYIFNINQNK